MKKLTMLLGVLLLSGLSWTQSELHAQQNKAFLGINFEQISEKKAEVLGFPNAYGSYVTGIIENTAASEAGLQPLDYIYGIDNGRTSEDRSIGDLLADYQTGDKATVHVIRNGKARQVPVTFRDRSEAQRNETRAGEDRPFLGVNRHTDNDDEALGVRIFTSDNSTAREMGLKNGDVITAINGHTMVNWQDISTAIDMLEAGKPITVNYLRDGEERKVTAPIKSYAETKEIKGRVSEWKTQEKAFLGIQSTDVSAEKARKLGSDNAHGSYVTGILKNTAAERAGLQPFDYIYGVDQYRTGEGQDLSQILHKYKPGIEAEVYFIRRQRKQTAPVTFGRREEAVRETLDRCEDPFFGIRQTHNYRSDEGVPVEIVDGSTAEVMGLQDGDVILRINDHPMFDWKDIGIAVDNMQVGDPIEVAYRRDGRQLTGREPIQSHCDTQPERGAFDFNFDFDFDFDKETPAGRTDLAGAKVNMQDMTREEAQHMKEEHGIDMPFVSNLRVEELRLFPNPNQGMFRLQFQLPQRGETIIRIFNAAGRLIYNYDLGAFQGDFSDDVDLSQNGPGTYFLEIRQGNQALTRKVVLSGL